MSIMCSYQDCLCVKYPCSSTAFFRLPTDNRRSTWIKNSGNKSLLNISEKAHRFFCENHFRLCDIRTQFNRKILRKHAVPIKHDSNIIAPEFSLASHQAAEFHHHYNEEKNRKDTNFIIEKLDENSDDTQLTECENLEEYKVLDTYDTTGALDDSYNLLNFSPTDNFNELQDDCEENIRPDILKETEAAAYSDEEANANQVDSSTIDMSFASNSDKSYEVDDEEFDVPVKKRKPNETELVSAESINASTRTSNVNDYQEDKHFALSLVGCFQRLPKDKKALAKLKILKYLTELDMGCPTYL